MRGRLRLAVGLVAIALVVVVNVAAYGRDAQVDLSAARRFSLSPDTRRLAKAVKAPLRITAFLNASGASARDARFLLDRYHDINRRITYTVVDPDQHPSLVRRFDVSRYSTVVLTYNGRRVEAPDAEELEISTGILRLLRGRTKTLCMLTGHGEAALDDTAPDGLSEAADFFRHNAYRLRTLDLTVGTAAIPSACNALLVAGPRDALLPTEVSEIVRWTKAAGRLFVLASPVSNADPNPLLAPWGIHFAGGVVVDTDRSRGLDVTDLIVEDLPSASPVTEGVSRLELPASGGLVVEEGTRGGLTTSPLAVTSRNSWVESNIDTETKFDSRDIPGPVVVAAAADDSRVVSGRGGSHIERTRVVATGTDAWLSNRFLDRLGNRRFLANAMAWLAEEEQLVAATSRPNQSRPLPFTPERQTTVLLVTVGLVPGAIVGGGLTQGLVRRRRHRR